MENPAPAPAPQPSPNPAPSPSPQPHIAPASAPAADGNFWQSFFSAFSGGARRGDEPTTPHPAPIPAPAPTTPPPTPQPQPAPAPEPENRFEKLYVNQAISTALSEPKLGVRDAAALAQLIKRDTLQINEAGEVTGLDKEIERLKTEHAAQFYGPGSADGGASDVGASDVTPGVGRLRRAYANNAKNTRTR